MSWVQLCDIQMKPRRTAPLPFMAQSRSVTPQTSVGVIESVLREIQSLFTIPYVMNCKNADYIYCKP